MPSMASSIARSARRQVMETGSFRLSSCAADAGSAWCGNDGLGLRGVCAADGTCEPLCRLANDDCAAGDVCQDAFGVEMLRVEACLGQAWLKRQRVLRDPGLIDDPRPPPKRREPSA